MLAVTKIATSFSFIIPQELLSKNNTSKSKATQIFANIKFSFAMLRKENVNYKEQP